MLQVYLYGIAIKNLTLISKAKLKGKKKAEFNQPFCFLEHQFKRLLNRFHQYEFG